MAELLRFLRTRRWTIIGALWAAGLLLGYLGFTHYDPAASPVDKIYFTIQLVLLESGAVTNPPLTLSIARFFLPLLAAQTSLVALANVFFRQARQFGLRFSRSHPVVIGTGPLGEYICRAMLESQGSAAYVSPDSSYNPAAIEDAGAVVASGTIEDPEIRERINLKNASHVLAFCEQDALNISTALSLQQLGLPRRGRLLPCIVHTREKFLGTQFIERMLRADRLSELEFDVVNVYELAARAFMEDTALTDAQGIIFIGFDHFSEQVLLETALLKQSVSQKVQRQTLVIDAEADQKVVQLCRNYPALEKYCCIQTINRDPVDIENRVVLQEANGLNTDEALALVRLPDFSAAVQTAIRIFPHARDRSQRVFVITDQRSRLDALFPPDEENLSFFGIFNEISRPEILLDIKTEQLAREFHRRYLESEGGAGKLEASWSALSDEMRKSNRRLAQHIRLYLRDLGYRLVPRRGIEAPDFKFSQEELDFIASREHERWLSEKRAAGWRYGERKDAGRKTNPYMKKWAELTPEQKKFNYEFIRVIPEVVAKARLEIIPFERNAS